MCPPITPRLPDIPIRAHSLQPAKLRKWRDVGDFWNDPRRWDGITDPHREMFWLIDRGPLDSTPD